MRTFEEKVNSISSDIDNFLNEARITGTMSKEDILTYFSSIICTLDTDVAIKVMEKLGPEGEQEALAIKINYGY